MERLVLEGMGSKDTVPEKAIASSEAVVIDAPIRDDHLQGIIHAPQDGYVMFAIPYEKGWMIRVDGEKQNIYRANLAFQGIAVKKGEHTVELDYQAPGFYPGVAVSALSCLVLFVLLYKRHYGLKKAPKLL